MATMGRGPTSETRVAVASGEEQPLEVALSQAEAHVGRMTPSPATEHLKASLETFRRTLESWDGAPPSAADLRSLRERVAAVLQLAKTTAPTVRIRRFG
jgi:hypothetical protein